MNAHWGSILMKLSRHPDCDEISLLGIDVGISCEDFVLRGI